MARRPLITVLMPVYNDGRFLPAAVESILRQSWTDFEFLIIDDGSTDEGADYLRRLDDRRVRRIRHERNLGITPSLREGVDAAEGRFLARMDSDDLSSPGRLERQAAFLEAHPDVGVVGSCCGLMDGSGPVAGRLDYPRTDLEIRWKCLLTNPFAHPAVMIRRDVLVSKGLTYDDSFDTTQDYDLWARLLRHTRGANLSEPLIHYRLHPGRVSVRRRERQLQNQDRIAHRVISEEFPDLRLDVLDIRRLRESLATGAATAPEVIGTLSELLLRFASKHRGRPGLRTLRMHESYRLLRLGARPAQAPRLIAPFLRLSRTDPGLAWGLLSQVLGAGLRRIRLGTRP